MRAPLVSQVFAVANNGVIGNGGELPWRVPTDLAFFKRTTLNKPLIMGRNTFESLPGILPDRPHIVVTSRPLQVRSEQVSTCGSLAAAFELAERYVDPESPEVIIAGGAQIYAQALPFTDRLIVTHIDAEPEGDTVLDCIQWDEWQVVSEECPEQSERDQYRCRFVTYHRR